MLRRERQTRDVPDPGENLSEMHTATLAFLRYDEDFGLGL